MGYKTYSDYNDAKAFFNSLEQHNEAILSYDNQSGMYEVTYNF